MNANGEKTGGRAKGTPNKVTSSMRKELYELVKSQTGKLEEVLNGLEGLDYIKALTTIMPYVAPKVDNVKSYGDKKDSIWDLTGDFD